MTASLLRCYWPALLEMAGSSIDANDFILLFSEDRSSLSVIGYQTRRPPSWPEERVESTRASHWPGQVSLPRSEAAGS